MLVDSETRPSTEHHSTKVGRHPKLADRPADHLTVEQIYHHRQKQPALGGSDVNVARLQAIWGLRREVMTIPSAFGATVCRPETALAHQRELRTGRGAEGASISDLGSPWRGRQKRLAKVVFQQNISEAFPLSLKILFIYRSRLAGSDKLYLRRIDETSICKR